MKSKFDRGVKEASMKNWVIAEVQDDYMMIWMITVSVTMYDIWWLHLKYYMLNTAISSPVHSYEWQICKNIYLVSRIISEVNWGRLNLSHPDNDLPPKIKSCWVTHHISDSTVPGLKTDIFQHGEYFSFSLVFALENYRNTC